MKKLTSLLLLCFLYAGQNSAVAATASVSALVGAKLIVQEEAVLNTMILKDLRNKINKFSQKLQVEQQKYEDKLRKEREEIEAHKKSADYAKKLDAWQKKVEAYQKKMVALNQAADEAARKSFAEITEIFNSVFSSISKKHGNGSIFKDTAFAYIDNSEKNVTSEFVEEVNAKHKVSKVSLPMISLE